MMQSGKSDPESSEGSNRVFATTQWSLVVKAAKNDSMHSSRAALEELCQGYWYPLYAYVRRRGYNAEESNDLTQSFFAQILEKNTIEHADPVRGKFRTFLLTSLKNFISNHWRSENTQKRGGQFKKIPLEIERGEEKYSLEPQDMATAEVLFDRKWAMTLLATTFERLKAEYTKAGKESLYEQIQPYLVGSAEKVPYRDVAQHLKITENGVKVAVHRLRKRCGKILREEIAQTVTSEEEVDEELREMFAMFGGG